MNKQASMLIAVLAFSIFSVAAGKSAFAESEEHVEFVTNIEFIRGHLEKALENRQAENPNMAVAHAGHPISEVFSLIQGEIKEHDEALATKLEADLTDIVSNINTMSVADVQAKINEINASLDKAVESVVSSSERSDPAFTARVIIGLLDTAHHEYEEGVVDGKVAEQVEYQDSLAFIHRAEALFNSIKAETPEHEAEELEEFFAEINTTTSNLGSHEQLVLSVESIEHELQEAFKLGSETSKLGGWEYIERINLLLDESVEEYEKGEFDEARALAREAYLDNYEFIESDIKADNPELMEKIEIDMREKLVKMIDDRKPVSEIEAHVDMIKADLQTAKAVVTPEFPVVLAVIAAVMAGAVAMTRMRGSIKI